MGSGCANTVSAKNNCAQLTSTDCTIYQGDSIPLLGICCGDTVTEVEKAIIDKLLTVLDGTGIVLSGVTLENAPFLKALLGVKDKTLLNMIQLLVDADTNLRALIAAITPTGDNFQFDLGCLSEDCCQDAVVSRDEIIQMLIDKYCDIQSILDDITDATDNINNSVTSTIGNYILNNINTCSNKGLTKEGSGATAKLTIRNIPPFGSAIPYWGPLTYFDASGSGLAGTPVCDYHIMNGQDGFPDWRGYAFASITGTGTQPIDARVNAIALNLPNLNAGYGQKLGELAHTLTLPEIPSHSHPVVDPGHVHDTNDPALQSNSDKGGVPDYIAITTGQTQPAFTGITIGAVGNNQPHINVQPTVYGVWIAPKNN